MKYSERDCVADTSSLITLTKGESIDCLGKFFRKVYIPEEVERECKDLNTKKALQKPFFEVRKVKKILPIDRIHRGELEAISLAVELEIQILLADDMAARTKASRYNLHTLSFADILILGKEAGFIQSVQEKLDKIRASRDIIKDSRYFEILKEADEL